MYVIVYGFTGPSLHDRIDKLEQLLEEAIKQQTATESRVKVLEKEAKDHVASLEKAEAKMAAAETKLITSEAKIDLLTTLLQTNFRKLQNYFRILIYPLLIYDLYT